jgi:peptide/nickel transport system permease protein
MLDVLGEDYIRTARAKGIGERRVVVRHGSTSRADPSCHPVRIVLFASAAVVAANILVNMAYAWLDLRVRMH